jgi:iron complex outermembrane recepter protein
MKILYTFFLLIVSLKGYVQGSDTVRNRQLEEVVIKAYEQGKQLKEVAAAVHIIRTKDLERFATHSIVQAVNTTAGIRMEERSPGSYRINIRGSSLRSPFGVRNVKVYYNDLPLTDPGGHTYLNGLGYYNFNSIEVVKGPGSSLYGAGTGGVLLIESMGVKETPMIEAEYTIGSYGLHNLYASAALGNEESKHTIGFQHQQSEGYRVQSALKRNILAWDGRFQFANHSHLKTTVLFSDLFYETPGALTLPEFEKDPAQARPATGGFPGAVENEASIHQKSFLAGLSYQQHFSQQFSNTTTAYGMFTELRNPAIRNYGLNKEPHFGGRTVFRFKKEVDKGIMNFNAGAEWQQGLATVSVFQNKSGDPDTLQSLDDINTRQAILFFQAAVERNGWEITAGTSLNYRGVRLLRSAPVPIPQQRRDFNNEVAPRLSLAKKWKNLIVYSSVAKGFSPPTTSELLPSGSSVNLSLSAETGINYDIGLRGRLWELNFDINAFDFALQNTIVQRRDAGGGDYFINAGSTKQNGIETSLQYPLLKSIPSLHRSLAWVNHTWHRFNYREFKQVNTDFSGNPLPGVAPHTLSVGIDLMTGHGLFFHASYFFSDRIPLNDANSVYADSYQLLHARLGFEKQLAKGLGMKLAAGVENLLDETYSLGNDINAFAGRYYNAAPRRNFYFTIAFHTQKK